MTQKIALSNLSLLKTALLEGPAATWQIAQEAGFDALKVNPLRGWNTKRIQEAKVPVTAFEALWRFSFKETLHWIRDTNEYRALIIDPLLFGYRAGDRKAREYASTFKGALGVDCPPDYSGDFIRVREVDAEKWPDPLKSDELVLWDTYHSRGYVNHREILEKLAGSGRIQGVDVQTRDIGEWICFLNGCDLDHTPLTHHLVSLRQASTVQSVSIEIHPKHIPELCRALSCSQVNLLRRIKNKVRKYLAF